VLPYDARPALASRRVTADEIVPLLAGLGLALWLAAVVLFLRHHDQLAAALNAVVALPFFLAPLVTLLRWGIDPAAYTRQYGTAALRELPQAGILLALSLVCLLGCGLTYRGQRRWMIPALLLNGAGLVALFYFAFFFHIF
jgi:hypothetical protein